MEVENYPKYLIYPDGRVFSKYTDKFLKPAFDKDGYHFVNLYNNEEKKSKKIHRLVALHYLDNPDNLPQVNHKDCNRTNNNVNNLEFCSNMYNNQSINTTKNFGNIYERKDIIGENTRKFRTKVIINGKRHHKSFCTTEEAQDWLDTLNENQV